jgi:site-specific recombinase XerD
MKSYRVNVEIFVSWCNTRGYEPLPASVETLAEFLEDQAKSCSISTIRIRFYAIRKIHRLLDLPDCTSSEEVNLVLRRIRRSKFYRPKQAKALIGDHKNRFIGA